MKAKAEAKAQAEAQAEAEAKAQAEAEAEAIRAAAERAAAEADKVWVREVSQWTNESKYVRATSTADANGSDYRTT